MEVDLRGYASAGPVKFVLSASGHMAGVISAPGGKYRALDERRAPNDGGGVVCRRASPVMDPGGLNGTNG